MSTSIPSSSTGPVKDHSTPAGVVLRVDFAWSKFRNIVSEKNGDKLTPLYIQHFRPIKPQLRIEDAITHTQLSTGTINNVSIAAQCTIHGEKIDIIPLGRLKTAYNYFSTTLSTTGTPVPISWVANSTLKVWNFVCLDSTTQTPIAKFATNWWAIKEVGNFYFEDAASLSKEARDEIVSVGLTILYVMVTRMNNPLNLLGSAFTKVGPVESMGKKDGSAGPVELQERVEDGTKHKQV